MEVPLIIEDSDSRELDEGGRGGGRVQLGKGYRGRSDAISYGCVYQRAAALVDLVSFLSFSSNKVLA